jgi:hypothetical protein
MKKRICYLLIIFFLTACNNSQPKPSVLAAEEPTVLHKSQDSLMSENIQQVKNLRVKLEQLLKSPGNHFTEEEIILKTQKVEQTGQNIYSLLDKMDSVGILYKNRQISGSTHDSTLYALNKQFLVEIKIFDSIVNF